MSPRLRWAKNTISGNTLFEIFTKTMYLFSYFCRFRHTYSNWMIWVTRFALKTVPFYSIFRTRMLTQEMSECARLASVGCLSSVVCLSTFSNFFWSLEADYFHISHIASIGGGKEWLCFCSNRIRTLVAMATYSFHWLIMGKVEIGNFCCLTADI